MKKDFLIPALSDQKEAPSNYLRAVIGGVFIISLTLSLTQFIADSVINNDGILYMRMAAFFQNSDPQSAMALYNWPFYPFLISLLSTLTGISLEITAHTLNAILSAITCSTFVLLTHHLGGRKGTLLLASLVILSFPKLNEYRNMIMRDHGYWAFYLLSIYFYLHLYVKPNSKNILAFLASISIATIFRVEGAVFFIFLSLFALWHHRRHIRHHIQSKLMLYSITFVLILVAILTLGLTNIDGINSHQSGKLSDLARYSTHIGNTLFSSTKDLPAIGYAENFLYSLSSTDFSENHATKLIFVTIILILISEIMSTLGIVGLACLIPALYYKTRFLKSHLYTPWLQVIFINIAILFVFTSLQFFLAGRYPVALSITFLLLLPFFFSKIIHEYSSSTLFRYKKLGVYIFCFFFLFSTLDGLMSFGPKKDHLKKAGVWLSTRIEKVETGLYSNDHQIRYYSQATGKKHTKPLHLDGALKLINRGLLTNYEYLAIKVSRKIQDGRSILSTTLKMEPIKAFSNSRGDTVYIFKQTSKS